MSRNFELPHENEREYERFPDPIVGEPSSSEPTCDRLYEGAPAPCYRASDCLTGAGREAISKLVHRLFMMSASRERRCVVFSGCEPDDSAMRITAWASEMLADRRNCNVCAVDGNLCSPSLHSQFGLPHNTALTDPLLDGGLLTGALHRISENLWIMHSGMNDEAIRESARFDLEFLQRRIAALVAEFDYVLIGTENIALYPGALMLAKAADGVVLVTEAGVTRVDEVEKAKRVLKEENARLLGAVLNNMSFPIPEAIYRKLGMK